MQCNGQWSFSVSVGVVEQSNRRPVHSLSRVLMCSHHQQTKPRLISYWWYLISWVMLHDTACVSVSQWSKVLCCEASLSRPEEKDRRQDETERDAIDAP